MPFGTLFVITRVGESNTVWDIVASFDKQERTGKAARFESGKTGRRTPISPVNHVLLGWRANRWFENHRRASTAWISASGEIPSSVGMIRSAWASSASL